MKKKIVNIVELIIEIAILVVFFSMKGIVTADGGHHYYEGTVYSALHQVIVYTVPFYVLWGLNLVMCLFGAVSKSQKKDGVMHAILPILLFIFTDWCILATTKEASGFLLIQGLMFALVIVAFIKRSRAIVGETPEKVIITNTQSSSADELKKYKELLDSGVISQEEFDAKKKQLLGL